MENQKMVRKRAKESQRYRDKNNFKIPLQCPEVPPRFLHALLRFHNAGDNFTQPKKLRQTNIIGNSDFILFVQFHYKIFLESNLTMDKYFDREILEVRVANNSGLLHVKEIKQLPLILAKHDKKDHFLYGAFSVRSKHPIRMKLSLILEYHNFKSIESLTFHDVSRGISLIKVENNVAFMDGETTGLVDGDLIIGKNGSDYYWIPDKSIIEKRYYCTKFPGICSMFFVKKVNLERHEKTCTDHTVIKSKQVWAI